MPEWYCQRPGRLDLFGCQTQKLDNDGRNSLTFQFGGDQTHGLVADRSDGNQQRNVDLIFNQFGHHLGYSSFDQPAGGGY